jgi:hypothetical protein
MKKKIIIIGAGLAGAIAYNSLKEYQPLVLDKRSVPGGDIMKLHPAVMRLRDNKVAEAIGARSEKVIVTKCIFSNGSIHTKSNIQLNNLYSRKVYGTLGRRSLNDIGDVERYIMPSGYLIPEETHWCRTVKDISDGKLRARSTSSNLPYEEYEYDVLISTVPMFRMSQGIVGCPDDFKNTKFAYRSVYVLRLKVDIPSCVHQTIYFPDPNTPIYRITIQNQDIIIEAVEPTKDYCSQLQDAFGIYQDEFTGIGKIRWKEMPIGKIIPINEDDRLRYIMWLTDNHNIYSFGRFAVWRPLRTDQLLQDIVKIKRIIKAGDISARYKARM